MENRSIILRLACWAALSLAVAACATTQEVERIVGDSQAALLQSYALQQGEQILLETEVSAPTAATGAEGDQGQDWREKAAENRDAAVQRIDAFLAANQGQPGLERTVNALRLRKALLLVVGGKPTLADAAFDEVDVGAIGNARDLALYKAHDALVWWWSVADKTLSKAVFEPKATRYVQLLDQVIAESPEGSAIRYYLATLRAHIYLKWSSMIALQHTRLVEGLGQYAREFDAAAQENIRKWSSADPDQLLSIPTENLRWFGQAKVTYDEYQRRYDQFLTETTTADPRDLDPELAAQRDQLKATLEAWPRCDCQWLADL